MSFLNSVLNSIGGSNPQQIVPANSFQTVQTPDRRPPLNAENAASKQSSLSSHKRKSDEALEGREGKVPKTNQILVSNTRHGQAGFHSAAVTRPTTTSSSTASAIRTNVQSRDHSQSKATTPAAALKAAKLSPEPQKKEPKKGSYAEIMARAQANQGKPQAVVPISHKPKDKMAMSYKKELKLQKQAVKDKKLGRTPKDGTPPSSSDSHHPKPVHGKSSKHGPQPTYTGTMKPISKPQPTYRGTMKPATGNAIPKSRNGSNATKRRINEYAATDDELDDDEQSVEDDGYGYDSQESDDMEAGFSDVEQEETAAAKAARLEDQREAEVEARLKREKEEKKRKLEALAKRAKPQRY